MKTSNMQFANRGIRELYNGVPSKAARKVLPSALHQKAIDKLTLLDAAASLEQLYIPPRNRLEVLRGDRTGQHAIRINDPYRICFVWTDAGAIDVEIVD